MASSLRPVTVAPKGMGLYDFVALQEGFFAAEGLDADLDWKTFRGTQSSWKDLNYFQRPQDRPYTQDKRDVIQGACVWGTICNASSAHPWDFSKFGRGERFYYQTLPREEFDQTLAQVERWGLDQHLKDRSYENLSYSVTA